MNILFVSIIIVSFVIVEIYAKNGQQKVDHKINIHDRHETWTRNLYLTDKTGG